MTAKTKLGPQELRALVRDVPDFPKPGIVFKDITPMLARPEAFASAIAGLASPFEGRGVSSVLGIEARGFIFASAVALHLGAGVTLVRKKGKLPYKTVSESYDLEYGQDVLEMHQDAVAKGEKVLIVDDVIATGGTAGAACRLVEKLGGTVEGLSFLIELGFLDGRKRLPGRDIRSLVAY